MLRNAAGWQCERLRMAVTLPPATESILFFLPLLPPIFVMLLLLLLLLSSTKAHAREQWIKCLICILVLLLQRLVFEINRTVCGCACERVFFPSPFSFSFSLCLPSLFHGIHRTHSIWLANLMLFNTCTLCLFGNYFDFEFILRLCTYVCLCVCKV